MPTFQMEKLRPDISINVFRNISPRREWRIMGLEKPQRAREVRSRLLIVPTPHLDQKGNPRPIRGRVGSRSASEAEVSNSLVFRDSREGTGGQNVPGGGGATGE